MGGMGGMVVFWGKGGRGSPISIYTNSRSSASAAATCIIYITSEINWNIYSLLISYLLSNSIMFNRVVICKVMDISLSTIAISMITKGKVLVQFQIKQLWKGNTKIYVRFPLLSLY